MKLRTKKFALEIMKLTDELPKSRAGYVLGDQLLRSGTGVCSNYRAACRAKTKPSFIHKMSIVEEESDETLCWMELMLESGMVKRERLEWLMDEASQLTAIMVASIKTARGFRN